MKLLTFDPAKKKKVMCGEMIGDTLFRDVGPQHFMRMVQGYGIQEIAFQEALKRGVEKFVLKETHTEQQWEADKKTWLLHSKIADYGHGKQRFLGLKFMRTHNTPQPDPEKEIKRAEQGRLV